MSLSLLWPLNMFYTGGFQNIADDPEGVVQAINQGLRMLLMTRKGEYTMEYNFGVGMPEFLFDLASSDVRERIIYETRSQISIYMPYVTVNGIEFDDEHIDSNILVMRIRYSVSNTNAILDEIYELQIGAL